jgi:hypothetical protein
MRQVHLGASFDQIMGDAVSDDLASGDLWWIQSEVWMGGQKFVHKLLIHSSCGTYLLIFVILEFSIREMSYCRIDEDIAWTGVEIEKFLVELTIHIGRHEADIGNTADVLACTKLLRVVQE